MGWRVGVLGGLLGAALGAGIVVVGADYRDWTLVLDASLLVGGAVLAIAVAVVSGLIPAIRAARLEPLETLRLG